MLELTAFTPVPLTLSNSECPFIQMSCIIGCGLLQTTAFPLMIYFLIFYNATVCRSPQRKKSSLRLDSVALWCELIILNVYITTYEVDWQWDSYLHLLKCTPMDLSVNKGLCWNFFSRRWNLLTLSRFLQRQICLASLTSVNCLSET